MTSEQLARALAAIEEIEQLAEAATVGPWEAIEMTHYDQPGTGFGHVADGANNAIAGDYHDPLEWGNAQFIAAARTDVPALARMARAAARCSAWFYEMEFDGTCMVCGGDVVGGEIVCKTGCPRTALDAAVAALAQEVEE